MRFETGRFGTAPIGQAIERLPRLLRNAFRPRTAPPTASEIRRAWMLAILADGVEMVLVPLFAPGVLSPVNDALDLAVAAVMIRLLGWHPALLPTFIAELVPGLSLFPTWTLSVWVATRGLRRKPRPPVTPARGSATDSAA